MHLMTNLANGQLSELQLDKRSMADAKGEAEKGGVFPGGRRGLAQWERTTLDAEMDADDAVAYQDGPVSDATIWSKAVK